MTFVTLNNLKIHYSLDVHDASNEYVLFLHGWGGSINSFKILENTLKNKVNTINLDLLGFGLSDAPPSNFTIYDNANYIVDFLKFLQIKKVNIIAHSFGGRLALILASMHSELINSLILIDIAGIKPKFNLKTFILIKKYKLYKQFVKMGLLKKQILNKFGSTDYKQLNNNLKAVFNRIINEDLAYLLHKINCQTLIFWGKRDKATPLYMAKKLNKNIKNSAIIIFDKAGHFSYLDESYKTALIVKSFLNIKE